uniref:Uncharacterized protein n=1 Tax=Tanacetum cinerariifolium TaxID=118510 RepID=A0A699L265_TANCI|nr:hypothetical protein [Tanacetum cinerariifolium]
MSADVARSHDGDGDGEGKGKRKPNLGGRAAGRLNTRDKTRNLSLKDITGTRGLVPIQFELRDKQAVMPLGDHAAHWSSYIGEWKRILKKRTKTRQKTAKPDTKWKRSKKTKTIKAGRQNSKPLVNKSQL